MKADLAVRGGTVVTPGGAVRADVGIAEGKIIAIGTDVRGVREIDAAGRIVLPGAIDAHVHMELPVRGDRSSDDFRTGTIAAAHGGVTTIVDFSVGSSETRLPEEIEARLETAGKSVIDFTLHGEVVGWTPGSEREFAEAVELGVRTFKFYTAYSRSGRMSDDGVLYAAFSAISRLGGTAMVHAENDAIINALTDGLERRGELEMESLPKARPAICEEEAIARVALIARRTGVTLRIAHISSADGLDAARAARWDGTRLIAETCPHYLLLDEGVYAREDAHLYAAMPPLRTPIDNAALWDGIEDGAIDMVVTDHCPFTRAQKHWTGSFLDLPYGLPGVETLLSLMYSAGVATGRITVERLAELVSSGPARALGIYPRKGAIAIGSDADLVIIDPEKETVIAADDLHMNCDFSPYEGKRIVGWPVVTISRGAVIVEDGKFLGAPERGKFIPQG